MRRSRRRLVVAAVTVITAAGACSGGDDASDTLPPLPVSPPPVASTAPGTSPSSTEVVATSAATATTDAPLTGDWDGARYDAGVIARVGNLGGFRTIDFDRYSYQDPERGLIDAPAFDEEPIAYAWDESPFVNVQEQLRTFVLADDVEVLLLSGSAAARQCGDPRPLPSPVWLPVGVSYLDRPAVADQIATLTYSDSGHVTRIRFTRGCID